MQAPLQAPARNGLCRHSTQRLGQQNVCFPRMVAQRSCTPSQTPPSQRLRHLGAVATASKLDNLSLFGDSTSSLMGGGPIVEKKKVSPKDAVLAVPLLSTVRVRAF
jgi:hypothetical protein